MLTISDYKNWALNDQRRAVALSDGGNALVTENVRLGGGLTRAIFRGDVKKARGDVLADFTRALSTDAQKRLFRSITLEGGNFEVQKMNTAIAGFKTGGVARSIDSKSSTTLTRRGRGRFVGPTWF